MSDGVNEEFLRTLLASNLIWSAVTITLTGVGGVIALVWRKRAKKTAADQNAKICKHCWKCSGALGLIAQTGGEHFADLALDHVITNKLCYTCIASTHATNGVRDSAKPMP